MSCNLQGLLKVQILCYPQKTEIWRGKKLKPEWAVLKVRESYSLS
jgi:hypothetical protein